MRRRLTLLLLILAASPTLNAARLPRFVLPHHYVLTITPDLEAERFRGEETISVSIQRPTDTIELNAAEITFREVEVTAAGETQTARVTTDEKQERATLRLARVLPVGAATIRIAYDGILNRQLRGFYIGVANGRKYLASQLEATDARRAFPSFDEPDMKATFQINVIADEKHAVISNSPIESQAPGPIAGKRTVVFATTPRLSTYHIALIVGDFACLSDTAEGIALRVCAQPDKVELGRFALQATKDVLTALNDYFDISYPFAKLDQIALTDFAAGAMENPGAITYRERILLVDENTASISTKRGSIGTIAHEIAHIWFGDMVTMRWWDDIWLNEGFATWLGRRAVARVRPQWTAATSDANATSVSMASDVLAATRPIRKSAETPDEIEQLFDGIAYGKTAALLRMLESYAGEEKFREGINLYMRRHAFGNASAGEFSAAIDDATGGTVTEILSSYVSQAGVPLVRVRSRCEDAQTIVDLQQSRFLIGRERPSGIDTQLWSIPVCFSGGSCVVLRERHQTFRLPGCRSSAFANADGRGYYITAYERDADAAVAAQRSQLSASEKVAFLRDQWLLVRAGDRPLGDYLEAARAFGSDRHVAEDVLSNLAYVARYLVDESDRSLMQRTLRRHTDPLLRELGWTTRSADTPEERALRNAVITTLGEYAADTETMQRARDLTNRWLRNREAIAPEVVFDITRLAAIAGDRSLYDAFLNGYRTARDPGEKARFLILLSAFRDPSLLRRTLQLTLTDEIRSQDIGGVLSRVLANPAGTQIGWDFINDNWPALEKKIPPGHVGNIIEAVANGSCDAVWRDRIRQFTQGHTLPQAGRATRIALERIENCAAFRAQQQASLSEWLRRQ